MEENKVLVVIISVLLIVCIGLGCYAGYYVFLNKETGIFQIIEEQKNDQELRDVDTYLVNKKLKKLNLGDTLYVNYWNDNTQTLNDKKISGKISTYNGIKIGTSKEKVIKKFNLNSKNTMYDCEIENPEKDGTTDVKVGRYKKAIFNTDYLDCALVFGYKNGKMLNYKELKSLPEYSEEPLGITRYYIDINGFKSHETVRRGKVIAFSISNY